MAQTTRRCLAGLLLALGLSGCASQPAVSPTADASTTVEVLTGAPPQPYDTLGVLDASDLPGTPASQVVARLVEQARRLGADAIILDNRSKEVSGEQRFDPATGQYVTEGGGVVPIFQATAIRRHP